MTFDDSAFIFDIDGTLVDLRKIWKTTYHNLYQQQLGFTLTDAEMKSMFGPPELECHTAILKGRRKYTSALAHELVYRTEIAMLETLSNTEVRKHLIEGALPCVQELQRQGASLACATGNLESIAKQILYGAELKKFFSVLACYTRETSERYQIVATAQRGLEALHGGKFTRTYVIGDSPSDLRAAKKVGAISVGVATGHYSKEELAQEKPKLLLGNLGELVPTLSL